jgi:diguanylate cyclase (GGDEF)-like protein/PAS domain S-box-containing protein
MIAPWSRIAQFAVAFFVVTSLTIGISRYGGGLALVWFGSAIAAMMLIRLPRDYWLRGLVAIMVASGLATSLFGFGPHMAVPLALINAFEAWLIARLLIGLRPQGDWLDNVGGLTVLVAVGGIVAPGIAAIAGGFAAEYAAAGHWSTHAVRWWVAHGLGTLIGFPFVLLVSTTPAAQWFGRWSRRELGELSLHSGAIALVTYISLTQWLVPILFLPIVPLLLAAFRCGREGAALGLLIIAAMSALLEDPASIVGSIDPDPARTVLFIQFYLMVLTMLAIPVSVALRQYELVVRELEERKALKRLIAEHSDDALLNLDAHGRIRYASPAANRLSGLDELVGKPLTVFFDPLDEQLVRGALVQSAASPGTTCDIEHAIVRDEALLWLEAKIRAVAPEDGGGTLVGYAVTIRNVTARKQAELDAIHASETDALTGLPNRRALLGVLERALGHAEQRPFAVAILDLDHFKLVNDTHGHLAGDAVLREVAAVMRRMSSPSRYFARLGGEEFALVSRQEGFAASVALCEQVREAIDALRFSAADGAQYGVSASIGCAHVAANGTAAQALSAADVLLYHAKRAGRNRVEAGATESERRANRRAA